MDPREQAAQDLKDINQLRREPAFARYWMRKLRERREALARDVLTAKVSDEERNNLRQAYLECAEIERLMDVDYHKANNLVKQ